MHVHILKNICTYLFSHQVKWNHFIMTSVYYIVYIHKNVYNKSLFHRDETKPTHIIGINTFLFLMQLIYKHSSPNYQHMINHGKLINKMLVYISLRKLKHFQPHSLHCHLWCFILCKLFVFHMIYICIRLYPKVDEAASTNFSFSSHTLSITLLNNCIDTVILAEQSLHHNIILEKLDHSWVNRICTKFSIYASFRYRLFHI